MAKIVTLPPLLIGQSHEKAVKRDSGGRIAPASLKKSPGGYACRKIFVPCGWQQGERGTCGRVGPCLPRLIDIPEGLLGGAYPGGRAAHRRKAHPRSARREVLRHQPIRLLRRGPGESSGSRREGFGNSRNSLVRN